VLDAIEACGTELLLLDDLYMLDKIRDGGQETNDHIKNLANHAACYAITGTRRNAARPAFPQVQRGAMEIANAPCRAREQRDSGTTALTAGFPT
jgi:hypothetical protein